MDNDSNENLKEKLIDGKIYKITNLVNGKCYIGQTINPVEFRFKQHCAARLGYIGRALTKYGVENFCYDVIQCNIKTYKELNDAEIFWIKYFNSMDRNFGYNLTSGGNNFYFSEEIKKKMSENHANVKGSNNPNYGKITPPEVREKISKNHADVSGSKNPRYGKYGKDSTIGGEKNPKVKLTVEQVIEIRENKYNLSRTELADKYNVHVSTIDRIIKKRQWRHI